MEYTVCYNVNSALNSVSHCFINLTTQSAYFELAFSEPLQLKELL